MTTVLKRDLFGVVIAVDTSAIAAPRERAVPGREARTEPAPTRVVVRDTSEARGWLRWLARHLAHREACALRALHGLPGVPLLLNADRHRLTREWIDGRPMHHARPTDPHYYRSALLLLRRIHRRGVAHNDLAKETNWLVTPRGESALVDFQLAHCSRGRGRFFRMLAHDDLRHLLKHKRTYLPHLLTQRERVILAKPSLLARIWMSTGKRLYLFVTRRVLNWTDREGAGDRPLR
jgi:RIO-like serine/threonine protein kinase